MNVDYETAEERFAEVKRNRRCEIDDLIIEKSIDGKSIETTKAHALKLMQGLADPELDLVAAYSFLGGSTPEFTKVSRTIAGVSFHRAPGVPRTKWKEEVNV